MRKCRAQPFLETAAWSSSVTSLWLCRLAANIRPPAPGGNQLRSRQEEGARWTANRGIPSGERQQPRLPVHSKGRNTVAALVARIQKRSARVDLDVPRVIAHG